MRASGLVGLFSAALCLTATPSHASTWEFTTGAALNDGALLSGLFAGTDMNDDGRLTETELSAWQFDFSPGSTGLQQFSLQSITPSDNLLFFLYSVTPNALNQFRVAGAAAVDFVAGSQLIVIDSSTAVFTQTNVDIVTSKVIPTPPALWLLGSALLGAAILKRKNRQ